MLFSYIFEICVTIYQQDYWDYVIRAICEIRVQKNIIA